MGFLTLYLGKSYGDDGLFCRTFSTKQVTLDKIVESTCKTFSIPPEEMEYKILLEGRRLFAIEEFGQLVDGNFYVLGDCRTYKQPAGLGPPIWLSVPEDRFITISYLPSAYSKTVTLHTSTPIGSTLRRITGSTTLSLRDAEDGKVISSPYDFVEGHTYQPFQDLPDSSPPLDSSKGSLSPHFHP